MHDPISSTAILHAQRIQEILSAYTAVAKRPTMLGTDERIESLLIQLSNQVSSLQEQVTVLTNQVAALQTSNQPEVAQEREPAPSAADTRLDAIRACYNDLMRGHPERATQVIAVLHNHNAVSLWDLDPATYPQVLEQLQALQP